jgi:hypothetical protein
LSKRSEARRNKLAEERDKRSKRIQEMRSSDRGLALAAHKTNFYFLSAILHFAIATLIFSIPMSILLLEVLGKLVAIVLMLSGIHSMKQAYQTKSEVDES